jgi:hypothetical protein
MSAFGETSPFTGPLIQIAIVGLVWVLGLAGLYRLPDGLIYGRFVQLPPGEPAEAPVLWLRADPAGADAQAPWDEVVGTLVANGASLVAFVEAPPVRLRERDRVLVGRFLRPDPDRPGRFVADPDSASVTDAWVATPPAENGTHYRQWAWFEVDGARVPALEARIAERLGRPPPSSNPYRVDFASGAAPSVGLARVLSGGVVPELLAGRVVVVGPAASRVGLHTPLEEQPMAPALFHALALRTLLAGGEVRDLAPAPHLAVLLAVATVALLLFHYLGGERPVLLLAGLSLSTVAAAWVLLHYGGLWLPVSALLLAQVLAFFTVARLHARSREDRLRAMASEAASRVETRWAPEGFYNSDEHWSQVAALVTQTLVLQRTMFLEKVPGDHRVRAVKALNCSFDDIHEKRRDYHRTPYTLAIEAKHPIRVERPYLRRLEEPEEQYLVPLVFAGEVEGFWALSSAPLAEEERGRFFSVLGEFGDQIAELLYHRSRWRESTRRAASPWRRLLRLESFAPTDRLLTTSLDMLQRRLRVLEGVLDGQENGSIVYDLFGGVVQFNRRMADFLGEFGVAPVDLTPVDFVVRLTGRSVDEARQCLRYLALERGRLTFPVTAGRGAQARLISLRALVAPDDAELQVQPFRLLGILCEVMDVTGIQGVFNLKKQLIERLGCRFRDDLEAVLIACSLVEGPEVDALRRRRVAAIMKEKVREIAQTMGAVEGMLDQELHPGSAERYPVDVRWPLGEALKRIEADAAVREVEVRSDIPRYMSLAFAAPAPLERAFVSMLRVLLEDASAGGAVGAALWAQPGNPGRAGSVVCRLSSVGFGFPKARLEEYLFGADEPESEDFKALREAARQLRGWGAHMDVDSEVGRGIAFEVRLEAFL